jgi:hypothetical protein
MGPWNVYVRDPNSRKDGEYINDMKYYGKPARFGYRMATTRPDSEGIKIELIQPCEGDNIYHDFLRDHGEGVQHLGWHIVEGLEAFTETTRVLEANGFPCIMSGRLFSSAFAYFDTTRVLHTILEVVWRDKEVKRPAPLKTFPEGA